MKNNVAARILVIDDHEAFRTSLARVLKAEGFSVRTAASGREGITVAREFLPAVVVCDMHMPDGNGDSVLAALRKQEGLELSQFILMTADREGISQRLSMDLGADDYLPKPFEAEEFLRCVNARLQRSLHFRKAEERALQWLRETISHSLPHEIFTPLTGIIGFAEVLQDEIGRVTPAEAGTMVAEIRQGANRLHRTLKNYLQILDAMEEKIPAAAAEERVNASELLHMVTMAAAGVAKTHRRTEDLTIECAALELPVSDHNLATIVIELTDNACKYSPRGTPLSVRVQRSAPAVGSLSISDRGRGMSPDQIAQVGAFRQFDRKKYEQQGLGLGLTLTQHLIERQGGNFRIENGPEGGTTVTASWPLRIA